MGHPKYVMISSEEFRKDSPTRIEDYDTECLNCGADLEVYEVTESPASELPENKMYFKVYCPKCDTNYKLKKPKKLQDESGAE